MLALWLTLPLSAHISPAEENSLSDNSSLSESSAISPDDLPIIGAGVVDGTSKTPLRLSRHSSYYGVGFNNIFDSYLSPLDYKGSTLVYTHQREGNATWAGRDMTSMSILAANTTLASNPAENGEFWDVDVQWAYGLHRNWLWGDRAQPRLRLGLGALWGFHLGGTYSTRNGNNPAQGRLATDLSVSGLAEYRFPLWNRQWLWRTQLDAPLLGLMFSPRFGQSYYEIFTVESRPRFYATYPLNAPSMRLLSTISLPLRHQRFSVGFQVNVRQSDIQELKRHAWNVAFVVGYTRTLNFLD